jgi:hypothetical protein
MVRILLTEGHRAGFDCALVDPDTDDIPRFQARLAHSYEALEGESEPPRVRWRLFLLS